MAGIVYFLTTFYRRNELALRICLFYGAATIAGAFSGLLAFGVFQVDHYLAGWKWLFLIEGAATILVAILSYWWIPENIRKCRFFTDEEKHVATLRILMDSSLEAEEKFSLKACKTALLQWRVAVNSVIALSYGIAAATVGNWIPIIVRSLVSWSHPGSNALLTMWKGLRHGHDQSLYCRPVRSRLCGPLRHMHIIRPLQRAIFPPHGRHDSDLRRLCYPRYRGSC